MNRKQFISGLALASAGSFILRSSVFSRDAEAADLLHGHIQNAKKLLDSGVAGKLVSIRTGLPLNMPGSNFDHENAGISEIEGQATNPSTFPYGIEEDYIIRAVFRNGVTLLAGNMYPPGIIYQGTTGNIAACSEGVILNGRYVDCEPFTQADRTGFSNDLWTLSCMAVRRGKRIIF